MGQAFFAEIFPLLARETCPRTAFAWERIAKILRQITDIPNTPRCLATSFEKTSFTKGMLLTYCKKSDMLMVSDAEGKTTLFVVNAVPPRAEVGVCVFLPSRKPLEEQRTIKDKILDMEQHAEKLKHILLSLKFCNRV